MAVESPSGVSIKWYPHNQIGENSRIWLILKAKLTGIKMPNGSQYSSTVNISESDADKIIENIKKDTRGYPQFDEEANSSTFFDSYEKYQKWLVETYLNSSEVAKQYVDDTQKENQSPGALVVQPKVNKKSDEDLVEEEIDPEILSLLGLEDVFDFTYEEYKQLLRQKAAEGRMAKTQMPTETIQLLTDEFKRVKDKTGSFTIPKESKKKLDLNKVLDKKVASPQKVQLDPKKLLPGTAEVKQEKEKDDKSEEIKKEVDDKLDQIINFLNNDLLDGLKSIRSSLEEIVSIFADQQKLNKKRAEQDRKSAEIDKKKKREEKLESGDKKTEKSVNKIAKPYISFFDRIKQFFMSILLGSAINFLLAVIKDPSIILNPIKNFVNGVVNFLNGIISFLWNFFVSPINFVINQINNGIKGFVDQINKAINLIPGAKPITPAQIPTIPGPPQIPTPFPVQQQTGGGQVINVNDISYSNGGAITTKSGLTITGLGKDTRLIAAEPGEIMMSNSAGDFFGRNNLLAMNAIGGGTNKPKMGNLGISAMSGGGQVGMDKKFGINRVRGSIRKVNQGLAPKGLLVVPGHTYGGGTPGATGRMGEFKANKTMAQFIVQQVKQRNPNIPVQYYEQMFEDSDQGLKDAVQHYKKKEQEGYEVIEIHHDAFGPQGLGAGLLGSYTGFSPLDSALGQNVGSFGANYKGRFQQGYAMNRGGISMVELAKLEGSYEQGLLKGSTEAKTASAQPVIKAILDTYGAANKPSVQVPQPPKPPSVNVVPLPLPQPKGQSAATSTATPSTQKPVTSFPSEDPRNDYLFVMKSLYNIIG